MRLLLDTHIAAWAVRNVDRLSKSAMSLLRDPANDIWFSHVSLWEIAVKRGLNRVSAEGLPKSPQMAMADFTEAGFQPLPILYSHICAVTDLPTEHSDPFDRLLIAQALTEPMRFVTHERRLADYSDTVILV